MDANAVAVVLLAMTELPRLNQFMGLKLVLYCT
jgi:hypothetical protein